MAGERDMNFKMSMEVKKYPCLYNYKLSEYSRKDVTDVAWNKISQKTDLSVTECKEKWKNIRSAFVRSLKPRPSGSSKKPYYLHDYLQFIIPYVKLTNNTESPGNVELLGNTIKSEMVFLEQSEDDLTYDYEEPTSPFAAVSDSDQSPSIATTTTTTTTLQASTATSQRKKKADDLNQTFMEYLPPYKKSTTTIADTDDETAKRYFLLSLLPDLKGLDEAQMRTFKIKTLLLIENIKENSTLRSSHSYTTRPSSQASVSSPEASHNYFSRSHSPT